MNVDRVVGKKMNNFSARSDRGILYNNDSLKGKITLVNFWFTECPGCIGEFEILNHVYDSLRSYPDFRLLAFTFDPPDVIIKTKSKYHLRYELISVSQEECYNLNFNYGFPTNLVIDKSAIIRCIQTGGPPDLANPNREMRFELTVIPALRNLLK